MYILQTLFRVRNKKETIYCYSESERINAVEKLQPKPEITRFKGLGEISPDEFGNFIGDDIKLDPIMLDENKSIEELLNFYMGKNTPDRRAYNRQFKSRTGYNRLILEEFIDISENNEQSESITRVTGMYKDWFLDYASYVIWKERFLQLKMVLSLSKEGLCNR